MKESLVLRTFLLLSRPLSSHGSDANEGSIIKTPFPTHRLASTALQALQVDAELSPLVQRKFSLITPPTSPVSPVSNGTKDLFVSAIAEPSQSPIHHTGMAATTRVPAPMCGVTSRMNRVSIRQSTIPVSPCSTLTITYSPPNRD